MIIGKIKKEISERTVIVNPMENFTNHPTKEMIEESELEYYKLIENYEIPFVVINDGYCYRVACALWVNGKRFGGMYEFLQSEWGDWNFYYEYKISLTIKDWANTIRVIQKEKQMKENKPSTEPVPSGECIVPKPMEPSEDKDTK